MNIDSIKDLDPEFKKVVMDVLPESVSFFISVIGLDDTLALIMELGGTEFPFPRGKESKYFDMVAGVIGEDKAIRICDEYSIERKIYIPMCTKAMALIRNRQIIAECNESLRNGKTMMFTVFHLARKHRLNYRQIEKIVN